MTVTDELTDEENAILAFVKRHFKEASMLNTLQVVNEGDNILEVRAILDYYRELYLQEGRH